MAASAAPPLALRDLTRHYGPVLGVEGLSLAVERGEIVGLIGLNGAGKSTSLRLAVGLIKPTRGQALLFGEPTRAATRARARLGYLPAELELYPELGARECLDLLGGLSAADPSRLRARREALAERLGLGPADLARRIGEMSHGMRQKLGLIQALQHEPELVVLDEPSDGLDPMARAALALELEALRARGAAVLLASHVLSEVERVADRVAVLHRGRLLALEAMSTLRAGEAVRVTLSFAGAPPDLAGLDGVRLVEQSDRRLVLVAEPPLEGLLRELSRTRIVALEVAPPRLDDLIEELVRAVEPPA